MDWDESDETDMKKEDLLNLSVGTRLSFENPNYFLSEVTARLNDALNSNTSENPGLKVKSKRRKSMSAESSSSEEDEELQDLKESSEEEELEIGSALAANFPPRLTKSEVNRTRYAQLNPQAMGVNLASKFAAGLRAPGDDEPKPMETDSDDVPLPGASSARPPFWDAMARVPMSGREEDLPFGWEKRQNTAGEVFYFHTGTGISQKERPKPVYFRGPCAGAGMRRPVSLNLERVGGSDFRRSMTSSTLSDTTTCSKAARKADDRWKRASMPPGAVPNLNRFLVRNLGSVEIPEAELTSEKSSKAVNRCIVGLSGRRAEDCASLIGQGEDLYLDLDDNCLKLTIASTHVLVVSQPIHTIRVWGVGRDNGSDFAYVAKNKSTRKYMCHVFSCDGPARVIANSLRDICKRIMIERNHGYAGSNGSINSSSADGEKERLMVSSASMSALAGTNGVPRRPTSLAVEGARSSAVKNAQIASILQTFPTPMDEPRKVLRAVYVGSQEVSKPCGMDVLHGAIDYLTATVPIEQWVPVNVSVAPSTIVVSTARDPGDGTPREQIDFECRVRFLSFLGIGKNIIYCGFIVHTAQEKFVSHVFSCEPSAAGLCRTVEAACKLRYQKCMDAHGPRKITKQQGPTSSTSPSGGSTGSGKSSADSSKAGDTIRSALKSMIGTIANATSKRMKSIDSS